MAEKEIPFRQIHLDFHTSEAIEGVCSEFDAEEFAQTSCGCAREFYYFVFLWTSRKFIL